MGTRLARELAEFGGDLSLEGLHFWKTAFSAMTHPATTVISSCQGAEASETNKQKAEGDLSSSSDKKVVLLPCKNPPSRKRVQVWLKARKQYESLQKGRRECEVLKTERAGLEVEEHGSSERSELPAADRSLKVELCGNFSCTRTQRRKKQSLSLILSPLENTRLRCKSTEASPVSDKGSVCLEQEDKNKEDDDDKTTCPESPELPTWQQFHQPSPSGQGQLSENKPGEDSPEPLSPMRCNSPELLRGNHSPSPLALSDRDERRTSPQLIHSTPFLRRRWRSKEDLDPVCSTPISQGKECASVSFDVVTPSTVRKNCGKS